jgi:hypothetical protein
LNKDLAKQILDWRCEIVVAGDYLQGFYQAIDRKQWDRVDRMSRGAREALARNRAVTSPVILQGKITLAKMALLDDARAEREAWLFALQALMGLGCILGITGPGHTAPGLHGQRTEASKSLCIALQAARTAFPEEDLNALTEEALTQALRATGRVMEELFREPDEEDLDPKACAATTKHLCEEALRKFVNDCLPASG